MIKLKRPDYTVGETVETEINTFEIKTKLCTACEGEKTILAKNNLAYKCPECDGKGEERSSEPCKKIIQMVVRKITMIIDKHGMQTVYECFNDGKTPIYGENELRKAV